MECLNNKIRLENVDLESKICDLKSKIFEIKTKNNDLEDKLYELESTNLDLVIAKKESFLIKKY